MGVEKVERSQVGREGALLRREFRARKGRFPDGAEKVERSEVAIRMAWRRWKEARKGMKGE